MLRLFLVASTAGTTNAGGVDPFEATAGFCPAEGPWHRVDGARAHAAVGRDWTDGPAQVIPYYFPYVGSDPSACAAFFKPVTHLVLTIMALPASRIGGAGASSEKRQDDLDDTRRSRASVSSRRGSSARRRRAARYNARTRPTILNTRRSRPDGGTAPGISPHVPGAPR